jgi:signal peptidase I
VLLRALAGISLLVGLAAAVVVGILVMRDSEGCSGGLLFRVEGSAMEPSFSNGQMLRFADFDGDLSRWDLAVFEFPLDPDRDFFKRVVALPGETVEVRDETIFIDGDPVEGDIYSLSPSNYTYGPKTVPADSYFVLGDNRRNSFDSHAWGSSCASTQVCDFVPAANIFGELAADTTGNFCRDE